MFRVISLLSRFLQLCLPLLMWQAIIVLFSPAPYLLPAPLAVMQTLLTHAELLAYHAFHTFSVVILGWLLALVLGLLLGVVLFVSKTARFCLLPWVMASQTVPLFAIAPLIVLWLGFSLSAKITVVVLMIFFPITLTFYHGLIQTPRDWVEAAESLGAKPTAIFLKIRLVHALGALKPGLKMATLWAPMGAIIAEWIGSSEGLGFLMLDANAHLDAALLFSALFVLIALTVLFYSVVEFFSTHIN